MGEEASLSLRATVIDAIRVLRRGWWTFVAAQALLKAFALLLLGPLIVATINALLGESAAIGNAALARFVLSPAGILTIVVVPSLALAGLVFEQAYMTTLVDATNLSDARPLRLRLGDAAATVLTRLPRLAALAAVLILLALTILLPVLIAAAFTYYLLLGGADINYYLAARPPRFIVAIAIGGVLAMVAAWFFVLLFIRSFLAIQVCLFEPVTAREAMHISGELSHGRRQVVVRTAISWLIIRAVLLGIALTVLTLLNRLVLRNFDVETRTAIAIVAILLLFNGAVFAFTAALDRAAFATFATLLYRRLRGQPAAVADPPREQSGVLRLRGALVVAVCAAVAIFAAADLVLLTKSFTQRRDVTITAHRAGAKGAPENSLAALRRAIDAGADAAEIDVQRTADGVVVVVHDQDLRRLGGSPLVVSRATAAELAGVDIGRAVGPEFTGERLATLAEFIAASRGRIRLSIELKYYGAGDPELASAVVRILRDHDFTHHANIISLDYAGLEQIKSLAPQLPRGYLVSASLGDVTKLDVQFLSVAMSRLTPRLRSLADDRGLSLAVWTVNDRDTMVRMLARGADDLVTDDPALAVETVTWYRQLSDVELILLRFREWLAG